MKVKSILLALVAMASTAFGASTVNIRNFTSATVGAPIVDAAGASLAVGTFGANVGYFNVTPDFGNATASSILAAFIGVDNTTINGGTRSGLFTGQTFNGTLGTTAGKTAFIVVGNNTDLALSTLIAVFSTSTTFTAPDAFGNSAQTFDAINPANVVFGATRSVTVQPSYLTGAAFGTGVQLVANMVPEPSAALLGAIGALGLLRRRRI